MKTLITGSSGFIGSYLIKALKEAGHTVLCLKHELLTEYPNQLEPIIREARPDYIFHLAAFGNLSGQNDSYEIFTANLAGTFNLLQATADLDYKSFINVSSSSVLLPFQTLYAATKRGAESLCQAYFCEYGKPIVSVRPFTVIGKGEQREHLIPTLIRSCQRGEKMPFNPYPIHDFVDARDMVKAMLEIAQNIDKYRGKSIGVGSGIKTSNEQVLQIVERLTGQAARYEVADKIIRKYDNQNWVANPARDVLIHNYSLEQTIQTML